MGRGRPVYVIDCNRHRIGDNPFRISHPDAPLVRELSQVIQRAVKEGYQLHQIGDSKGDAYVLDVILSGDEEITDTEHCLTIKPKQETALLSDRKGREKELRLFVTYSPLKLNFKERILSVWEEKETSVDQREFDAQPAYIRNLSIRMKAYEGIQATIFEVKKRQYVIWIEPPLFNAIKNGKTIQDFYFQEERTKISKEEMRETSRILKSIKPKSSIALIKPPFKADEEIEREIGDGPTEEDLENITHEEPTIEDLVKAPKSLVDSVNEEIAEKGEPTIKAAG